MNSSEIIMADILRRERNAINKTNEKQNNKTAESSFIRWQDFPFTEVVGESDGIRESRNSLRKVLKER